MVGHRYQRGQGVANDFRGIEAGAAGVVPGHEDPADRVEHSTLFRTFALSEITWIFMEKSRYDRFGKEITHHLIGVVDDVPMAKAFESLAIYFIVRTLHL